MIRTPDLSVFLDVVDEDPTRQKIVAMEELSELIQAISKDLRGQPNRSNIAEEMADVYIMLHEMEYLYDNKTIIRNKIYEKAKRLDERMKEKKI